MKPTHLRLQCNPAIGSKLVSIVAWGFLISLGLTSRAAEDPTRFLFATNWFATFTHTLNENGSLNYIEPGGTRDNCAATWHFTHEITVSCQLTPDPLTISHPYFRNFIWKRNDSAR